MRPNSTAKTRGMILQNAQTEFLQKSLINLTNLSFLLYVLGNFNFWLKDLHIYTYI